MSYFKKSIVFICLLIISLLLIVLLFIQKREDQEKNKRSIVESYKSETDYPRNNREASQRSLRIAIMDTYPWGFLNEDRKPSGIYYDFARHIIEEAGFSAEYMIVPYTRAIVNLESGKADITMMYSNERLKETAINVATIVKFENVILGRSDSHYASLRDLHGKLVGRLKNAKYDKAFESDEAIKKHNLHTYEQLVKMLINRRLDAIIGLKEGFYFNAKELGFNREVFGKPLSLNRKNFTLHLSKQCSDFEIVRPKLHKAVEILKSKNTFAKILRQWLDKDSKNPYE